MNQKNVSKKRVLVAMSGGVDSSVAAALLVEQSYDVIGFFMKLWTDPDQDLGERDMTIVENKCCSLDSRNDADRVAAKLGIPLYTLNFRDPFKTIVVDPFLEELEKGRTPNPCVWCNKTVRFDLMYNQAMTLGVDYVATGHYIQTETKNGEISITKGNDELKDQSYFLYNLTQEKLSHLLFPVGHLTKDEVRKEAEKRDLFTKSKHESQGLCFTAGKNHIEFVKKHLTLTPGKIRDTEGNEVGDHDGIPLYTLGQRAPVGGPKGPWFVVGFSQKLNEIIVTNNPKDPALYANEIILEETNWVNGEQPEQGATYSVRVRHGHRPVKGQIYATENNSCKIVLLEPVRAVMPGQSAVCYDGDRVVGGGVIASAISNNIQIIEFSDTYVPAHR